MSCPTPASAPFPRAAGPAEPLRPLASVASGGESSRIMLALKAAPGAAIAAAAHQENISDAGDLLVHGSLAISYSMSVSLFPQLGVWPFFGVRLGVVQ